MLRAVPSVRAHCLQPTGEKEVPLAANSRAGVAARERAPVRGRQAGLFGQLAASGINGQLVSLGAARRQLPRVVAPRVTPLAHEMHISLLVDGHDSHDGRSNLQIGVRTWPTIWLDHTVHVETQAAVVEHDSLRHRLPRADAFNIEEIAHG